MCERSGTALSIRDFSAKNKVFITYIFLANSTLKIIRHFNSFIFVVQYGIPKLLLGKERHDILKIIGN